MHPLSPFQFVGRTVVLSLDFLFFSAARSLPPALLRRQSPARPFDSSAGRPAAVPGPSPVHRPACLRALGPPRPGVGGESAPAAGLFPVYASRGSGISFPPDFFKFLLTAKNQYDIFLISNRSTRRTVYDGNYFIQ